MRISIIGHSGSGKTTLARRISEKKGIPYLDIDRLWFEAQGHVIPLDDTAGREKVDTYIKERVEEFAKEDAWVTAGWYGKAQRAIAPRADIILFLDISLPRRMWGHLYRTFFEERHKELTKWDDIKFAYKMIRRTRRQDPRMREFIAEHADKVKILHSFKEIDAYLAN